MKNIFFLLSFLVSVIGYGQKITGDWNGVLDVQGTTLRLVFHISESNDSLLATLDSPDQNTFGIPASEVSFADNVLLVKLKKLNANYKGTLKSEGTITGTYSQSGMSFNLNLSKEVLREEKYNRPQEPKKPYGYLSEDIKFPSENNTINLAGTLTLPKKDGNFPAVILISGSGPQNRDEEFMTHKPFLVLADYLTKKGIAVLRYDDRGYGKSNGNYDLASSLDFANDVKAGIGYLKTRKEIDKKHIGLIGHSEGGLIAPIVVADSKDVDFIILLAAPGAIRGKVLLQQLEATARITGMNEEALKSEKLFLVGLNNIISKHKTKEDLEERLREYYVEKLSMYGKKINGMDKEKFINSSVASLMKPWHLYFVDHNPSKFLKKVKCPVLAINGSKDTQVIPENLALIEKALREGGNSNITIKEYEGMNHLFQKCETGAMDEYPTIDITIDPSVLNDVSNWILNVVDE